MGYDSLSFSSWPLNLISTHLLNGYANIIGYNINGYADLLCLFMWTQHLLTEVFIYLFTLDYSDIYLMLDVVMPICRAG